MAGALGTPEGSFVLAIVIGRGLRYLALGLLAVAYGDVALDFLARHGVGVSLAAVGLLVAGYVGYRLWSKAGGASSR